MLDSGFIPGPLSGRAPVGCRLALTAVAYSRWQPMSREQFSRLRRGQRLEDRRGRVWTVTAEPREEHGLSHVVIRSGDLVRRINERWSDEYALLAEEDPGTTR
jgi:hypothetical protein